MYTLVNLLWSQNFFSRSDFLFNILKCQNPIVLLLGWEKSNSLLQESYFPLLFTESKLHYTRFEMLKITASLKKTIRLLLCMLLKRFFFFFHYSSEVHISLSLSCDPCFDLKIFTKVNFVAMTLHLLFIINTFQLVKSWWPNGYWD